MKSWLKHNDIEMYSKHNERKSVVAQRCIITLKNKIWVIPHQMMENVSDLDMTNLRIW